MLLSTLLSTLSFAAVTVTAYQCSAGKHKIPGDLCMPNGAKCPAGKPDCWPGVYNGKEVQSIVTGNGQSECQVVAICGGKCGKINGQPYCL